MSAIDNELAILRTLARHGTRREHDLDAAGSHAALLRLWRDGFVEVDSGDTWQLAEGGRAHTSRYVQ